jgi:hypothetical protein
MVQGIVKKKKNGPAASHTKSKRYETSFLLFLVYFFCHFIFLMDFPVRGDKKKEDKGNAPSSSFFFIFTS